MENRRKGISFFSNVLLQKEYNKYIFIIKNIMLNKKKNGSLRLLLGYKLSFPAEQSARVWHNSHFSWSNVKDP